MLPGPQPTIISRGQHIWEEFYEAAELGNAYTVAIVGKHHVADTLSNYQAIQSGQAIEFMPGIRSVLLSYGRDHRKGSFNRNERWHPFINSMDGYIFTDYSESWRGHVEVYRENWMPTQCIAIWGDKGQAAELLGTRAILFDDKEDNIDLLRARSTVRNKLDGVVVQMGKKAPLQHCPRLRRKLPWQLLGRTCSWLRLLLRGRGNWRNVHGDSYYRAPYVPLHDGHNRW